jgi:hypothetical protein
MDCRYIITGGGVIDRAIVPRRELQRLTALYSSLIDCWTMFGWIFA